MIEGQPGSLGTIERQEISLDELDTLARVISEPPATDGKGAVIDLDDPAKDPVTGFLETFATPAQLEAFEKAYEGNITRGSKEATLWPRFRNGILWHPAIIGKLVSLSGIESLDDIGKEVWKDEGDCKEDLRFVASSTYRPISETRELMAVCDGCPVRTECEEHVADNFLQYGFWAGVARSKGTGYHDDGTPITLEEKREKMDAKRGKTS